MSPMTKTPAKKLSARFTKDFAKTLKGFVRATSKGGYANVAFVIGYLDSATGRVSDWSPIPAAHVGDYANGRQAADALKSTQSRRKNKSARL